MKKKVLFISTCHYPNGDALAIRQHSVANLFISNGWEVEIIAYQPKKSSIILYDRNIKCNLYGGNHLHFKQYLTNYFSKCQHLPHTILVTGIPLPAYMYVIKIAKRSNLILYRDSSEWFSLSEFIGFNIFSIKGILSYFQNIIKNTIFFDKHIGVICISKYLYNYFTKNGARSIRIPVIMDLNDFQENKIYSDNLLRITYAGSSTAGRKDYIKETIHAITKLNEDERSHINFMLIGLNSDDVAKISGLSKKYLANLRCLRIMGRVPRSEVIQHLNETDFTILIRSSTARYAKAGFPTKVVESLMSSTPVICNMTSDLGMYLKDGYDCIEVADETPDAIVKALRRALALTPAQKDQMKKNARKTAEENFDYRLYIEEFGKFIKNES